MTLKIIAISDTHNTHKKIKINPCDILLHTGDFSKFGSRREFRNFLEWFSKQPAKHKIFICGNHDSVGILNKDLVENTSKNLGVVYLCNNGINIDGINFYGMPWTPKWGPWSFMEERNSSKLMNHVNSIPDNTHVLLTHGPPFGTLDNNFFYQNVGCELLKNKIKNMKNLKLHCFGHIHESGGKCEINNGVYFVNSCQVNTIHKIVNNPYEIFLNV